MAIAEFVPCALQRNIVGHQTMQQREALGLDFDGEMARPVTLIFDGGLAPGRRIPKAHWFWPLAARLCRRRPLC